MATARNDFVEFLIACQRDGRRVAAWRAGQGQHAPEPLRHTIRSDRVLDLHLHTSTACSCPGRTFLSIRSSGWPTNGPTMSIMPWNLRAEITDQLDYIRNWGGQLVSCHDLKSFDRK